jgi:hypothetical protein
VSFTCWLKTSPRIYGEQYEARNSRDEGDRGQGFDELHFPPTIEEFLHTERGDYRNADAIEDALPTKSIWVKGEKREKEPGHGKRCSDGPIVERFTPLRAQVSIVGLQIAIQFRRWRLAYSDCPTDSWVEVLSFAIPADFLVIRFLRCE